MNLQPKRESLGAQKEFLNTTQGLIHKVGGVTLGSGFTADDAGYLKAGSAVELDETGVAIPFATGATGIPFVTAHDVKLTDGAIVGVLESAFLKESVVTATEAGRVPVTAEFVTASNGRFHLR